MKEQIKIWYHYNFKYELSKKREKFTLWFVWRLPDWVVYWCSIRLISAATIGKYSNQVVPELTAMDALKRWEIKDRAESVPEREK